jgi:large subunit ribosomal protein L6e
MGAKHKGKPKLQTLTGGVARFSKSALFKKKAMLAKKQNGGKEPEQKAMFVEKKIGGAKNGETRMVRVKKLRQHYPTEVKNKWVKMSKKLHPPKVRASIKPGVIAILLAGVHQGKHVVVLKAMESGLILVTGPLSVNGCPLRRVDQRYMIATKTSIDVSSVKIPDTVTDDLFKKKNNLPEGAEKKDGVFADNKKTKEKWVPSEERKKIQKEVESQVEAAIKAHPEADMMTKYLRSKFYLTAGQYPHKMIF